MTLIKALDAVFLTAIISLNMVAVEYLIYELMVNDSKLFHASYLLYLADMSFCMWALEKLDHFPKVLNYLIPVASAFIGAALLKILLF